MTDSHTSELAEELRQFQAEKEQIRGIIGQIGGKASATRERALTMVFVAVLVLIFVADVSRHILDIPVPLPPLFSLEVGVLLVSIKIILMIRQQARVEHFQFWMLNSIEFRVNQISNRLRAIENGMKETGNMTAPQKTD